MVRSVPPVVPVVIVMAFPHHTAISNTHFHRAFQAESHDGVSRNLHRAAPNFPSADGAHNCANYAPVGFRFDAIGI